MIFTARLGAWVGGERAVPAPAAAGWFWFRKFCLQNIAGSHQQDHHHHENAETPGQLVTLAGLLLAFHPGDDFKNGLDTLRFLFRLGEGGADLFGEFPRARNCLMRTPMASEFNGGGGDWMDAAGGMSTDPAETGFSGGGWGWRIEQEAAGGGGVASPGPEVICLTRLRSSLTVLHSSGTMICKKGSASGQQATCRRAPSISSSKASPQAVQRN